MEKSKNPFAYIFGPSFNFSGRRFEKTRYFFWRIRHRREIEEGRKRWQDILDECDRQCKEALTDKEKYGKRPLIFDLGMGLKIPIPVSKPGNQWKVGTVELKDGTILPTFEEIEKQ